MMTPSQEIHLSNIKGAFTLMVDKKYRQGALEHGGDIRDNSMLQLLNEAIAENLDQFTYLFALREKLIESLAERVRHETFTTPSQ